MTNIFIFDDKTAKNIILSFFNEKAVRTAHQLVDDLGDEAYEICAKIAHDMIVQQKQINRVKAEICAVAREVVDVLGAENTETSIFKRSLMDDTVLSQSDALNQQKLLAACNRLHIKL